MSKGVEDFCIQDGIWIARPELALCLATALRAGIQRAHAATSAVTGRDDKAGAVYRYLLGPERPILEQVERRGQAQELPTIG